MRYVWSCPLVYYIILIIIIIIVVITVSSPKTRCDVLLYIIVIVRFVSGWPLWLGTV
jgi:hypothetical protein